MINESKVIQYMKLAYKEALKAYKKLEVPVGAIIVKDGIVIAKAYNLRESKNSSLAHAEILCIKKACEKLNSWRLDGCSMYVTLEPCPMCAGAIIQSRISNIYFGAKDEKNGVVISKMNMLDSKMTWKVNYEYGIMEAECSKLLSDFFKEIRKKKI